MTSNMMTVHALKQAC